MTQTFLAFLPFALAAAVSPMMLTEQTLLLTGANGKTAGRHYAMAAALVLLVFVSLLVFFGRAISLPQEPSLSSTLDIIFGFLLVSASLLIRHRREHGTDQEEGQDCSAIRARYGLRLRGLLDGHELHNARPDGAGCEGDSDERINFPERELLVLILVLIASTPAWLPLALATIAPGPGERALLGIGQFIERHGRRLTVILLLVIGLLLVGRGVIRLIG